ncbi:MAG: hypothetical protein LBF00_02180 [Mycoplasmataceae bacterium]|nr:hypothetical protein [Mycoplasmataceae bacterium]
MKKKEIVSKLLQKPTVKKLLVTLIKWGNLTQEQMAKLCRLKWRQTITLLHQLDARLYESNDKGLNLVVWKKYPFSSKRLYSATGYAQRRLGITKEKTIGEQTKLAPRYETRFNFYEVEHTDWCIKALLKEFGDRPIDVKSYWTARNVGYMWFDIFKEIKDIWFSGVEERKPDLLVWDETIKGWICIEVENTPKSDKRMRIILRSLFALGNYAKRFKKVKIYANEKLPVYNKWKNLLPYVETGDIPEQIEILKLNESLEKY